VVDERGRTHGFRRGVRYSSASLVKAMLLVAYLQRGDVRHRRLRGGERRLLGPMVRVSDNDAASAIYERVGMRGLIRLAHRAGMRRFVAYPVWGGCQVTARDQARFFSRIRSLLPRRHRAYGLGLLRRIVPSERWGIPRGAPPGWRLFFKGGWFPDDDGWRVHQAALLRHGKRRIAIAVLTRGNPNLAYGAATIRGVTARLLRGYR
jgi:Beta-lactamase enzyme family